jgi:hypothetical protein
MKAYLFGVVATLALGVVTGSISGAAFIVLALVFGLEELLFAVDDRTSR